MLLYSGKLVGRQEEQAHSLPVGKSSLIYFQDSLSALEGFFRPYSSFNISFAWVNLYRSGAARSPAGSRMFVNSRVDSLPCFGDSKLPLKFSSCSFQWSFRLDPVTSLVLGFRFSQKFFSPGRSGWWKGVKMQILWMLYPWDPHTPLPTPFT